MVSRMAIQKGFDIIAESKEELMKLKAQWVILGNGEEKYENLFRELAKKYPEKVSVYIGFNNELSHLIEAAADIFLMPSFYEPCGLNQIYSLKYGTVPIVRNTGGLADTVVNFSGANEEEATGFCFDTYSSNELIKTIKRAIKFFDTKNLWKKIQQNGMNKNFSWENSARQYLDLYKLAAEKRQD